MSLSPDDVDLAYRLILGREASQAEVSHAAEHHADLTVLRHAFLASQEFTQKYEQLKAQTEGQAAPTLIHLHIPKTAGTSLAEALSRQSALQPNMTVHDATIDELVALPRQQRRKLRYIRGHLSLGTGRIFGQPYRHMCLIRRPGPRIFSFYQFIMRTRTHPDFEAFTARGLSFGEYLEYSVDTVAHRLEIDNGQIRRLAGRFDRSSFGAEPQLLRMALHTALDPDMLFGFVEHSTDFIALLHNQGYLPDTDVPTANVSPNSDLYQAAVEALTPEQTAIFEAYTAWDTYFYDLCHDVLYAGQIAKGVDK